MTAISSVASLERIVRRFAVTNNTLRMDVDDLCSVLVEVHTALELISSVYS